MKCNGYSGSVKVRYSIKKRLSNVIEYTQLDDLNDISMAEIQRKVKKRNSSFAVFRFLIQLLILKLLL